MVIVSYPTLLSLFDGGVEIQRLEAVDAILFALGASRGQGIRGFISSLEYYLHYNKEYQGLDIQTILAWEEFAEWLEDGYVYSQLTNWAEGNRIDSLALSTGFVLEPVNNYSFLIRISS